MAEGGPMTLTPVLIPFLAGLLFGRRARLNHNKLQRLNPLFGGSAFRTFLDIDDDGLIRS